VLAHARTRPADISDDHDAARWNEPLDLDIWAAFLAEYLARQFAAPNRLTFIRGNRFDLLLVVMPVRHAHPRR
jgi:hypothetical protein